jgi:CheY-like chemotaxis protein
MARILVADDQESMRLIVAGLLREKGHEISLAEDGLQAYQLFQQKPFDLIVADVNMPRLNGLEFLAKVKTEKPGTKVVFVTGMLEETVRIGSEKLGLDGLILKPFDKTAALQVIEKALK